MPKEKTALHQRIESGKPILIAEVSPPTGGDPAPLLEVARLCAGKVHALGVSDNRDRVCMSALAAAGLVAAEGIEPILHVVTRDRNRIALVSDCLGAGALGIRNILCTSGTHQTLGRFRAARNVFDLDSIQLLRTYAELGSNGSLVGEEAIEGVGPLCLGAVANPYADPLEMQIIRLAKKVTAGARFLVTQPVFDIERFEAWFREVTGRGLHQKAAILAGVQPLSSSAAARSLAEKRPSAMIPRGLLKRIASGSDAAGQRAEGLKIARETVRRLSALDGLRGFQLCGDHVADTLPEMIENCLPEIQ